LAEGDSETYSEDWLEGDTVSDSQKKDGLLASLPSGSWRGERPVPLETVQEASVESGGLSDPTPRTSLEKVYLTFTHMLTTWLLHEGPKDPWFCA
jgi:hypothetical protein